MNKVLFVCLGNICRSPMAEAIFKHYVVKQGLSNYFEVDSAGTASYHIGAKPDKRTLHVLKSHSIETTHLARQICKSDFENFDYIFAMDTTNLADLKLKYPHPRKAKLILLRRFDWQANESLIVPDPYYGDVKDFENVYEILDRSISQLFSTYIIGSSLLSENDFETYFS